MLDLFDKGQNDMVHSRCFCIKSLVVSAEISSFTSQSGVYLSCTFYYVVCISTAGYSNLSPNFVL